jgi:hypothetical protein
MTLRFITAQFIMERFQPGLKNRFKIQYGKDSMTVRYKLAAKEHNVGG